MKIGLLSESTFVLYNYWNKLKDKADCRWAVTTPTARRVLQSMDVRGIYYKPIHMEQYSSVIVYNLINQYLHMTRTRRINRIIDVIDPDLWLFDMFHHFTPIIKKNLWVQTFHSVCFKEYFFNLALLSYDLLLLPGEYHKNETKKRFHIRDDKKLRIVGWPKTDDFFNGKFDRRKILSQCGLSPDKKTVMYAPTWGGYGRSNLFTRWFDCEIEIFEFLCSEIKEMGLNFIVKLHSNAIKDIRNKRFQEIALKYGALWVTKNVDYYMTDPNPYLWITDVLVSDVSGIISDFMVLNRPVVFIDPDERIDVWRRYDMPPHFRKGHIIKEPKELMLKIEDSLRFPDRFRCEREDFISKIFYKPDGKASERAAEAILELAAEKGLNTK